MRLTVVGIGYLGLTHAVCMADLGHEVLAIDVDRDKIIKAAEGEVPFFEPGLEPLLRKNIEARRLRFTTSYKEIAEFGDVHFLCVGTPEAAGGTANLSYLHDAVDALAQHLRPLAWWWESRQSLSAQLAPLWLEYAPLRPQEIRSKSHGTPSFYVRGTLSRTRSAPIASSLV